VSERKVLDMRVAASQCKIPSHPRVSLPKVQDLLAKSAESLCVIEDNAGLQEALQRMEQCDSGAILVTEHGRLVGIAFERDCVSATTSCPQEVGTKVRDIMTPCRASVSASDSLYDCLHVMSEKHRYLAVINDDQVVALISREQVLSELVVYLERVFHEHELDQQIVFLRGTYSC
jgi:signal-transduction protein with cAMP-binding, CBS, and nucleotidyltransferase domain